MVSVAADIVRTADGVPLKVTLRRIDRARKLKAVALVVPLFLFILLSFAIPIGVMLFRAVENPEIAGALPNTVAELGRWNGAELPDEATYAALAGELQAAHKSKTLGLIGKRLNYEMPGVRSKIMAIGRAVAKIEAGPYKDAVIGIDPILGERRLWTVIKSAGEPYTIFYLLSALDFERTQDGDIVNVSADRAIFRDVFLRTMGISMTVTLATLVLGFPVAYLLASLPARTSSLLMILVLLPFWTSLLVRTTAWVVLLQTEGVVNDALMWLGVVDERLQLIFSRFGTIVAMTHIQLPFTLLPIYSVMKTISPTHVRAARSLGAGPFVAFWRVYFPQTVPGIAAGCLLTFILSLGYYITPALVGGPTDQMVSSFVAIYTNTELNWGMASALGAILLAATLVLYLLYNRLIGIDKLKLG
jgi:putative spermidine/putrescine transport system permease protein